MPESHEFLCTTCGNKLDYPASFEGQTKVCDSCGLNTILRKTGPSQPVPIKLPPADQLPSSSPEGSNLKTPSQGAASPETVTQENVPIATEPEALGKPSPANQEASPAPEVSTRETPSQADDSPETVAQENVPVATEPEVMEKPSKVKAICVFHCVGGPFNILLGLFYLIFGIILLFSGDKSIFTFFTKLGGPLLMVMGVLVMAIGAFEAISAFKHFGENARPKYKFVKLVAILEIVAMLGASCLSVIFGILSLIFMADQRVKEYYD